MHLFAFANWPALDRNGHLDRGSRRQVPPPFWNGRSNNTAKELAALICERFTTTPVRAARPIFWWLMRRLTREHGALLIFDEVLSAFRMGPAGRRILKTTPICARSQGRRRGIALGVSADGRDIMHT